MATLATLSYSLFTVTRKGKEIGVQGNDPVVQANTLRRAHPTKEKVRLYGACPVNPPIRRVVN